MYQPQTEAISPILDEPKGDSNLRDSTIIRNSISKLESDIEITMKKLHGAKLNQVKSFEFVLFDLEKILFRMKLKIELIDQLLSMMMSTIERIPFHTMVLKH